MSSKSEASRLEIQEWILALLLNSTAYSCSSHSLQLRLLAIEFCVLDHPLVHVVAS